MKNKTETNSREVRAKRSNAIDVRDDDHSLENRRLIADILGTRRTTPVSPPPRAPKLNGTDALGMFFARHGKRKENFESPPGSPPQNCNDGVQGKRFRKDDDDSPNVSPQKPVQQPPAFVL